MSSALDELDRKIIALLRENAKRSLADIGDRVGLSPAAVKRRIDRLEREQVIRGYTAVVDEQRVAGAIEVVVEIYAADRTAPGDMRGIIDGIEEVVAAYTVSGEPDALLRLRVQDIPHLERIIERLRRNPNVVRTRTMLVLSTLLDRSSAQLAG
jgi:DNA-binding Lrp family transcriptional regulator